MKPLQGHKENHRLERYHYKEWKKIENMETTHQLKEYKELEESKNW